MSMDEQGAVSEAPRGGEGALARLLEIARCPRCGATLSRSGDGLRCADPVAPHLYPVVDGIPILINEARSLFSFGDFRAHRTTTVAPRAAIVNAVSALLPNIDLNLKAARNYRRFADLLLQRTARPRILVVGGGISGEGMDVLTANPAFELIETDVYFGARTALICDAHDLPFAAQMFDGVIVQAVLEHVLDPYRCVEEIHRVLKDEALVYAETPFMQQVHLARFDFTRFTDLGHRRLFRRFTAVDSGAVGGAGMALAWSYQYFLLSFFRGRLARAFVRAFVRCTAFWLKYIDRALVNMPGTLDAASGYYFLGRKCATTLTDRQLVELYRGALR